MSGFRFSGCLSLLQKAVKLVILWVDVFINLGKLLHLNVKSITSEAETILFENGSDVVPGVLSSFRIDQRLSAIQLAVMGLKFCTG